MTAKTATPFPPEGLVLLSRADILGAADLATEDVFVPEWGGPVRVRALSGVERDAFEVSMLEGRGASATVNLVNMRAKLVARTVVDDAGTRLFSDADMDALGRKNAAALARIFDVAQRLSGLSSKDVDQLTESLGNAPSVGSGSA